MEKKSFLSVFSDWIKSMSLKNKIVSFIVLIILLIDVFLAIILTAFQHKSALRLDSIMEVQSKSLYAINKPSKNAVIAMGETGYFGFSTEQIKYFEEVYKEYKNAALILRVEIQDSHDYYDIKTQALKYGFLSDSDFDKKNKFINSKYDSTQRVAITANLVNAPKIFDISMSLDCSQGILNIPHGFFVSSIKKVKILQACVVPAMIGFDISDEIAFYGFNKNGGNVDFFNKTFDFTGSETVFSGCEYVVRLSKNPSIISTAQESIYSNLNFTGEKLSIKNIAFNSDITIPPYSLKTPYGRVDFNKENKIVTALLLKANNTKDEKSNADVLIPIRTDPGLIITYKKENWRCKDYELFEWDRFPQILFFDTLDYQVQSRFFTRLAYFVEKQGFRGRLLTNQELQGKHGYNAHDYSAASMAEFFNKASAENFELNSEELLLKEILIKNNLFSVDGDFVKANEGGIVSISQESELWLRHTFMAHEGWHTIFFKDEDFRNFVGAVFYTMDRNSLDFILDYFNSQPSLGYDPTDDYLIHNEFMAYIMQQPLKEVKKYFIHLANRGSVIEYTPKLADYIRSTQANGIEDAAIILNDYVFDHFGIVCGNISLVEKN